MVLSWQRRVFCLVVIFSVQMLCVGFVAENIGGYFPGGFGAHGERMDV